MAGPFDAFVVFAEMRTGSNLLEESLNGFSGLACLGEVFNPTFIGHHNTTEMLGYDMDRREADPVGLLDAIMSQTEGIPGFRLFHDHDPRIIDRVLPDPRIAKVILTRNPLDSYVSRKIATATGQWRLTDMKHAKAAKIRFDAAEFSDLLDQILPFRAQVRRALQQSGQTAFTLQYEDLRDPATLEGLARYLGSDGTTTGGGPKLKRQNPGTLRDKVENYEDMVRDLGDMDRFGTDRAPEMEPEKGAQAKTLVVHPTQGVLFCPVKGGPDEAVLNWMGRIGDVGRDGLVSGMNQKDLRGWMKDHPGFKAFAVLRHPVARAYDVFNRFILPTSRPAYADPRRILRQRYKVPLPKDEPGGDWTIDQHKAAFEGFLDFLKGNLAGQTSIRVDPAWASQTAVLQGMSQVVMPSALLTEETMGAELAALAARIGAKPPDFEPVADPWPFALGDIYDGKIERRVIDIYRRDYIGFGFSRWNAKP